MHPVLLGQGGRGEPSGWPQRMTGMSKGSIKGTERLDTTVPVQGSEKRSGRMVGISPPGVLTHAAGETDQSGYPR